MEEVKQHVVYIIQCKDGTLYTGYTNDLNHRLKMHISGTGAKYTRGRGPFILKYKRLFETKQEAMQVEYRIKQLKRADKLKIIVDAEEGMEDV